MKNIIRLFFAILLSLIFLSSCTGIPEDIKPVDDFKADKYLGKWYEIARLDNKFEVGLNNVSAEYTLREDGGIDVFNKGFDYKKNVWKPIKGRAYFIESPDIGRLKVTFYWPFYASYNIIYLDNENYSYAMVCGYNKSYFWILARNKNINKELLANLIDKAQKMGFATNNLIYTNHN